jgi:hypothetical protein
MNRSYSKIRHIQEANQRLEKRSIENLIVEDEYEEGANPILQLIRSLVQGGKSLMGTAAKPAAKNWKLGQTSADVLMQHKNSGGILNNVEKMLLYVSKTPVKMTETLMNTMARTRNEIIIAGQALLDLDAVIRAAKIKPDFPMTIHMSNIKTLLDYAQTPKGQMIDLIYYYNRLTGELDYVSQAVQTTKMSPKIKTELLRLESALSRAKKEFETALTDLVTQK